MQEKKEDEIRMMRCEAMFGMLTSSTTPGYAERATINDFGAIIGKAMEPCKSELCTIKMLVSLR